MPKIDAGLRPANPKRSLCSCECSWLCWSRRNCSICETPTGDFPSKPIRFITGFLPGGVSDTIARVTGDKLGEQLGQRVIIDGRPGAGGVVSMEIAGRQIPTATRGISASR